MKMKRLIVGAFVLATSVPVLAAPIAFDFNSITLDPSKTTDGLVGAANSLSILNYMNSVLGCSPGCVSSVTGALATAGYNSDGFGYPKTLGNTDGATDYTGTGHPSTSTPDKFLMNDDFGIYGSASNSITITFANPWAVGTVINFDWEIFADGNCGNCTSGSNFPDLKFYAGSTLVNTFLATIIPSYDPQGMGHYSYTLTAATNKLQWVDWPPEIGIDNLSILPPPLRAVPEPSPLALAGLALGLLALVRWKTRGQNGQAI